MKIYLALLLCLFTVHVSPIQDALLVVKHLTIEVPLGYVDSYSQIRFSPDNTLLAVQFHRLDDRKSPIDPIWQVYDLLAGRRLGQYANFLAWYADSQRMLVQPAPIALPQVIDTHTGNKLFVLPDADVTFDELPIQNAIAALTSSKTLRIYDADNGQLRAVFADTLSLPRYSPDQSAFAFDGVEGLRVYDTAALTLVGALTGYRLTNDNPDWSPNGKRLLVTPMDSVDSRLGPYPIWTLGQGVSEPIYNPTSRFVWSPDSRQIAVASDYTKLRLYDAETGALRQTIREMNNGGIRIEHWTDQYLIGFSGDYAYSTTSVKLFVWDIKRQHLAFYGDIDIALDYWLDGTVLNIYQYWSHRQRIDLTTGQAIDDTKLDQTMGVISPDHRWILDTGTWINKDGPVPIDVYQADSLMRVARLEGHTDIISRVLWSSDSHYLVSVGEPSVVIVWKFNA